MQIDYQKLERTADMLKAVAHPLRIAILELLEQKRELTVTEIHEALEIEQAVASHHLSIMRTKGVLTCKREGNRSIYSLRTQVLSTFLNCLENCQKSLNNL